MRAKAVWGVVKLLVVVMVVVACVGCETWKGFQRDWQTATQWDKGFQDKYW